MGLRNAILQYNTLSMMCILITGLKWRPQGGIQYKQRAPVRLYWLSSPFTACRPPKYPVLASVQSTKVFDALDEAVKEKRRCFKVWSRLKKQKVYGDARTAARAAYDTAKKLVKRVVWLAKQDAAETVYANVDHKGPEIHRMAVSAKYVGQPDISRCSSPVSDGRLKNACPNVRPNFQTFINNLTDTNIRKYSSTNHVRPVYSNKMRIFHKGTLLWQAPWRSPFCNHCTSSLRRQ